MFAPVYHVHPLTSMHRTRLLPVAGSIMVRKGQKVDPGDIVAEMETTHEYLRLNAWRGLGIPQQKAGMYLHCKPGNSYHKGDVLAGPVGLFKKVVRAPQDCRVVSVSNGEILLELIEKIRISAGYPGKVIDLVDDHGVVIEVTGAVIQGVWGNGKIDTGMLSIISSHPDEALRPNQFNVTMKGSIIVGGCCTHDEILKVADDLPIRGLVLASMNSSLIALAQKVSFPIILIEGFGHIPMNSAAYKLLSSNNDQEATLIATPWDRFSGTRPEVIIPLPSSAEPPVPKEVSTISSGKLVHIVRAPYAGKIGTVVNVHDGRLTLPNGISARVCEVSIEKGPTAVIPMVNLEILESE